MLKSKMMILALLGFSLTGGLLGAQTVAEDIVKGSQIQGIEFKNYVGPHKVIESRAAIQGIGLDLGRQIRVPGASAADYGGKYRIVRIHDPLSEKLSADVLILEAGAGVDHIRNLNWIISSYLQQAFQYSVTDADLLANFITRYNAFYRGKMDYVSATFIPAVAASVTPETVGLALSYADWPGKTRMLIPLRDSLSKGLGGSINTEEISNKDITGQMAQDPGSGLVERKKLADLKEGEIVQEQKAIAQAEAKGPATPGTTAVGPSTTPPAGDATATKPAAGAAAAGTAPVATTATPAAAAATSPATTATTAPATLPVAQAKKDLAARDEALQSERKDIVKTETKATVPETLPAAVAAKPASTVAFVKVSEASKMGQLWLVDPATNKVWKKSDLNSIRQLSAPVFGAGLLVVAGDAKAANGAIRLVLVSKDDATVLLTGEDDVSADTPLVLSGSSVLALTKADKGGWVLGLFDSKLKAVVKGSDALTSVSAIVVTSGGILVQGAGGGLMLLDPTTLKKKSNTEG